MSRLLFLRASPRAESKSTALAEAYIARLRSHDAAIEVDTIDLAVERLPDFDGNKVAAKMNVMTGADSSEAQRSAWDQIRAMAQRFASADIYVIATPMWNGGVPYKLKQYIDLIHQPGLLFGLEPATGYFGLLTGKRAVLSLTSGAWGPNMAEPAFGVDFHGAYLKFWLTQAGVTDQAEIRFQPSLLTQDPEGDFAKAQAAALALADHHAPAPV